MNSRMIRTNRWRKSLGLFAATIMAAAVVTAMGFAPPAQAPAKPQPPAKSDSAKTAAENPQAAKEAPKGDPYPLDSCIVSGEKLGSMGKPVVKVYDGREVRFCCNGCVKQFEAKKDDFLKKIDERIIAEQLPKYPLKNCVVMEKDPLTGEGDDQPVNLVYKNRLVRFCCGDCVKDFKADPAKYLKKIDAAVVAQQKPTYPLDTCPVTGEKLGADAIDHVYGVTLIRFCDKECLDKFNADPLKYTAMVQEAAKAKQSNSKSSAPKPAGIAGQPATGH